MFLARTERDVQPEHNQTDAAPTPGTLAIKLYRAGTPQHDWLTEVAALERCAGAHVVGLSDIAAAAADRTALVLERLEGASLETLLRERAQLSVGEAITITAPIVETIERMHVSGVVHGAVNARSVLFARDGAPVLARFGSALLIEPEMPRARRAASPGLMLDVSATVELAASVLRSLPVDREVLALLAWLENNGHGHAPDVLAELTSKLYDLGEPAAVQFHEESQFELASTSRETAWRSVQVGHAIRSGRASHFEPATGRRDIPSFGIERQRNHELAGPIHEATDDASIGIQATTAFLLPTWLTVQLDQWLAKGRPLARAREAIALRVPAELAERAAAARTSLLLVRPRVWLIAAGVLVALVTAVNVVAPPAADNTATDMNIYGGIGPGIDNEIDVGHQRPDAPAELMKPSVAQHPAILADDPVAAAVELIAARERCMHDRSVLCLDGIAQAGSAALVDDQNLVRSLQDGAELTASWSLDANNITVLERLGGSVLLGITVQNDTVKTILMMKGDAGWRFRDYLS